MRLIRCVRAVVVVVAIAVAATAATPQVARAQRTDIDASPKGTIGLGVLGAEVGFAVPALAGLDDWWWYAIFPAVGAAGGAVAGWYAIDEPNRHKVAVSMLTVGMALIIPTAVLTLSLTAYDPEDERSVVPAEQGASRVEEERQRAERLRRAGPGLVRRSDEGWLLTAPGVAVAAVRSHKERILLGAQARTEVQVPLLTGVF
ncbi:MAG: hypothetical protein ACOC9O_03380 [Myxococcota bacterium]